MAKKEKEICYSFVYTPAKPSCLKADGPRDYEKLNAMIKAAKDGDKEAQMLVFEQYSGTWQSMCHQSNEVMYRLAMDYEDFQSEAFICYLLSLKNLDIDKPENFKQFFIKYFENRIADLCRNIEKQIIGHKIPKTQEEIEESEDKSDYRFSICYSMQETYANGNPKYDFEDTDAENEYFKDCYPRIKNLLTEQELQVVIYHYVEGFSIKETSKKFGIASRTVDNLIKSTKEKLKVLRK